MRNTRFPKYTLWFAAALAVGVSCGDDGDGDSFNFTGDPAQIQAACEEICQKTVDCFPGLITVGQCETECTGTADEIPDDVSQACIDAANRAFNCQLNSSCEELLGACLDLLDDVDDACGTDSNGGGGEGVCSFDCSQCADSTVRLGCDAGSDACGSIPEGQTRDSCCEGLAATFTAQCS